MAFEYEVCKEDYLNRIRLTSTNSLSLYDDVFHIIGKTEKAFREAFDKKLESNENTSIFEFRYLGTPYSTNEFYQKIVEKGGNIVKKEDSPNITCIIYGSEPSLRAVKKFEGKAKFVSISDAAKWLYNQSPITKECRIFANTYQSSHDSKLRPYQQKLKDEVFIEWRTHYNVMLQLPTGTGKTVLFTSIINDLVKVKDSKIVILAHRKELIDQISEHLSRYDIKHGIITSGRKRDLDMSVQVASVQTLTHEKNIEILDELKPKFIIIDEAHHSLADSYTKFWKHCKNCWKLGVTATPYRLNNKTFMTHFDEMVESLQIEEFISQGYLAEYDYLVDNPFSDLSKTIKAIKEKSSTGDYKTATLLKELNVAQHIQRLIVCYEQYVKGKKGIVYAINKEHAHNICDAYKGVGIEAVYIDSDTPKRERSEIVDNFKSGKIQVMVNVDIFSEGFDCPDVEFIQLARPTWSLAKFLQQVGRGMRPCEGKSRTVILDNSRMFVKFGLPSKERKWIWHFEGSELLKGLYKQEDSLNEAILIKASKQSSEMMVKIDKLFVTQNSNILLEESRRREVANRLANIFHIENETKPKNNRNNIWKALGIVVGLSAALIVLWQSGLIILMALIGLGIAAFAKK